MRTSSRAGSLDGLRSSASELDSVMEFGFTCRRAKEGGPGIIASATRLGSIPSVDFSRRLNENKVATAEVR